VEAAIAELDTQRLLQTCHRRCEAVGPAAKVRFDKTHASFKPIAVQGAPIGGSETLSEKLVSRGREIGRRVIGAGGAFLCWRT
jgi:hypothetical protein